MRTFPPRNFHHVISTTCTIHPSIGDNLIPQYVFISPMKWIPHPSYALIQTSHHPTPLDPLHLLSVRIPQQFYLLQDLLFLEIPDAYDLFSAIDVRAPDDRMCIGSRGDVDGDLGVGFCERGNEWRAEECAEGYGISKSERDGG